MTKTHLLRVLPLAAVLALGMGITGCGPSGNETTGADPVLPVQGARIDSAPAHASPSGDVAPASSVAAIPENRESPVGAPPESNPADSRMLFSISGSAGTSPGGLSGRGRQPGTRPNLGQAQVLESPENLPGPRLQNQVSGPILSDPSKFKELPKTGKDDGEYKFVSFDLLSGYEYFLVPTGTLHPHRGQNPEDQIPKYVRDLNGTKVVIEGYMVPIDVDGERIKSFILTNSRMMCCYGAMPWINEWIFVEMENKDGADFFNDTTIRVKGILDVGEEIEDGMVISLYRMRGDAVLPARAARHPPNISTITERCRIPRNPKASRRSLFNANGAPFCLSHEPRVARLQDRNIVSSAVGP